MTDRIGYVVVTYNQASGRPELDYSDIHADLEDAGNERDWKADATAAVGRGERHVVAEIVPLDDEDTDD